MTVVVTGSAGRIGSLLRLAWPPVVGSAPVLWTARQPALGLTGWDIGRDLPPPMPRGAILLHLAGVVGGDGTRLPLNAVLTCEVCRAAVQAGARHVFVASTVAVYRPGPSDLAETDAPDPANPYGAAKWQGELAAREVLSAPNAPGLTVLRIGNVAGADALLGRTGPMVLDPVEGQSGGPLRSYIGPGRLASVLAGLIDLAVRGRSLPATLNLAEPGVMAMADLLTAAGRDWRFGPPNPQVVPRVGVDTGALLHLVPIPAATPAGIVADLAQFKDRWP